MGAVRTLRQQRQPGGDRADLGIGQAPAAAFGPGTQTTVDTGTLAQSGSVAVDAAGNVFISDNRQPGR